MVLFCTGCSSYVTPGGAADLDQINRVKLIDGSPRQPAPQLPANFAVVRVQAAAYKSYAAQGFGSGRFSVITAREAPSPEQLQLIAKWPAVDNAALLNASWLPEKFESIDDLRGAAAKMQADVLLVYTVETTFKLHGQAVPPEGSIALGDKASAPATVSAVASAALVDVRTGYVYGRAEAPASADVTDVLKARDALEARRLDVEHDALAQLMMKAGKTWADIAQQYQ
jgi:hypothetical protein